MIKTIHRIFIAVLFFAAGLSATAQLKTKAEVFFPGKISTGMNERDMAVAPSGDALYYTIVGPGNVFSAIVYRTLKNNKLSEPQVAGFSGRYSDLEPAFSPDGKKLFFASNRPLQGDGPPKDFDIWYVEQTAEGWSGPKNAGAAVNTSADEFYPSVARNGNLYFTAAYKTAIGKEDIFCSAWKDGAYQPPVNLGDSVNSKLYEFNAYIDADEKMIIFTAYGRSDDMGRGDLYISYRLPNGQWSAAKNMGPAVNSAALDYCPALSPDGQYFYFTSERKGGDFYFRKPLNYAQLLEKTQGNGNGQGDIYRIKAAAVLEPR
jgi:Tol biopolymer transport system component